VELVTGDKRWWLEPWDLIIYPCDTWYQVILEGMPDIVMRIRDLPWMRNKTLVPHALVTIAQTILFLFQIAIL